MPPRKQQAKSKNTEVQPVVEENRPIENQPIDEEPTAVVQQPQPAVQQPQPVEVIAQPTAVVQQPQPAVQQPQPVAVIAQPTAVVQQLQPSVQQPVIEHQPANGLNLPAAVSPLPSYAPNRPGRPGSNGKVKRPDITQTVDATLCHGNVAVVDVLKADGTPAYKKGLIDGVYDNKPGTEKMQCVSIRHHKVAPDSEEKVTVGKKNVPDSVIITYCENNDELNTVVKSTAACYARYTESYNKSSGPKPRARPGRILNEDNPRHLDEILFEKDVAMVVTQLYTDRNVFNNADAAEQILSQYFSLISIDEATDLVMNAFDE